MHRWVLVQKMVTILSLLALAVLPLMANKDNTSTQIPTQSNSPIPNLPEFSITFEGESLLCSPTGLIK